MDSDDDVQCTTSKIECMKMWIANAKKEREVFYEEQTEFDRIRAAREAKSKEEEKIQAQLVDEYRGYIRRVNNALDRCLEKQENEALERKRQAEMEYTIVQAHLARKKAMLAAKLLRKKAEALLDRQKAFLAKRSYRKKK